MKFELRISPFVRPFQSADLKEFPVLTENLLEGDQTLRKEFPHHPEHISLFTIRRSQKLRYRWIGP